MKAYFSQFGEITRMRLSRNKKTGHSKHFAFVEFKDEEVARIVASTMDNYLMFGHILKCKFAPQESLHPDLWKGANKRYKVMPKTKIEKSQLEASKTAEQWSSKIKKEEAKRKAKKEQMKAFGYEYESPVLTQPDAVLGKRKLEAIEEPKGTVEHKDTQSIAPVVPDAVKAGKTPKDEVAAKKLGKKDKKSKKGKKGKESMKYADSNEDASVAKPAKKRKQNVDTASANNEVPKQLNGATKPDAVPTVVEEDIVADAPRVKKAKSKKSNKLGGEEPSTVEVQATNSSAAAPEKTTEKKKKKRQSEDATTSLEDASTGKKPKKVKKA